MKNPNDIVGNRTRDLPAWSVVPQQTAPPPTRINILFYLFILFYFISVKNLINTDSRHLSFVRYYLKVSHRREYFTHSV